MSKNIKTELLNFFNGKEQQITVLGDYEKKVTLIKTDIQTTGITEYIPVYQGIRDKKCLVCDKFDILGYYVPSKGFIYENGYIHVKVYDDENDASYRREYQVSETLNEMVAQIREKVGIYILNHYNDVLPAEKVEMKNLKKRFNNGENPLSKETCANNLAAYFTKENVLNRDSLEISSNDILDAFAGCDNTEVFVKNYYSKKEIEQCIARNEAERREFEKMCTNTEFNHIREVKMVLNQAREDGVKFVTATFDFGYEQVTEKITTSISNYTWLKTGKATDDFDSMYYQPISQKDWGRDYEDFFPYIKKIVVRNKTLFEHEVKLEHVLENRLCNAISRYVECGDAKLLTVIDECLKGSPNLSLQTKDGKTILHLVVNGYYGSKELFESLVNVGANLYQKELSGRGKDITTIVNEMVSSRIQSNHKSREIEKIRDYIVKNTTN